MKRAAAKARAVVGDRALAGRLVSWFRANAREFPWRVVGESGRRAAYRSLVSELMLQQTQAARVAERFGAFMERFPSVGSLAAAREEDVMAAWAGLGYYRRARLLHAAAKMVVAEFGGEVPRSVESLRSLPGVGEYTAGAVASIVFGERVAAVDGNVVRVLLRLNGRDGAADEPKTFAWVRERAAAMVRAATSPGEFNEALMELGARVCTPMAPKCGACPWADGCVARLTGRTGEIPRPKKAAKVKRVVLRCAVVTDSCGRVLMQRAGKGALWAGLWGLPSAADDDAPLAKAVGVHGVRLREAGSVRVKLTHREVELRLWRGRVTNPTQTNPTRSVGVPNAWIAREDLGAAGVSSAHLRAIAAVLGEE